MSNETYYMKKLISLGTLAGALVVVTPAQAGGFFSLSIALPGLSVNMGAMPPPVYVTPAPVCLVPAPVYAPPVVMVMPATFYVRPVPVYGPPRFGVVRPPGVVYRSYRHYVAAPPYCR